MVRKCLIPACTSNYGPRKVIVWRQSITSECSDSQRNQQIWRYGLEPYIYLNVISNSVICVKHWPEKFPTVKLRGKERPWLLQSTNKLFIHRIIYRFYLKLANLQSNPRKAISSTDLRLNTTKRQHYLLVCMLFTCCKIIA